MRKEAKVYVNEMIQKVCAKAVQERGEKASPPKQAAELDRVPDEELQAMRRSRS